MNFANIFIKISPFIILLPLKVGRMVKYVPFPISEKKQCAFAIRFVIKLIKDKHRKLTIDSLSDALIFAIYGKGISIEKKKTVHKIGLSNRHLLRFFK